MKKLQPWEQAILFQYCLEKGKAGMPDWAENQELKIFARLMNRPESWAKAAYEQAVHAGMMDRTA
ncbi:MAG: hypothetical protein ABSG07_22175 [Terriglobales bacterium]|jgi:hypothetical protein